MYLRNTHVLALSLVLLMTLGLGTALAAWQPPSVTAPGIDAQGNPKAYERMHKKACDPAGDNLNPADPSGDMLSFFYDQNIDRLAFRVQMHSIESPNGLVNYLDRDGVRIYICMDYQPGGTTQLPDGLTGASLVEWDRCLVVWSDGRGGAEAKLYDSRFETEESKRIKRVRITPEWYMVEASLWLPGGFEEAVVQSMGAKASDYHRVAPQAAAEDLTPIEFYVFTASDGHILDSMSADNHPTKGTHNVAFMHHGNQSLTWTDVFWGTDPLGWDFHWSDYINDGNTNNGFDEVVGLHDTLNEPVNIHLSSPLQTAAAWYYPTGAQEGFNEWLASGVAEGWCGMITSAFAQQIMPFLYDAVNDTAVAKETSLIDSIYNYTCHVAWVPERVWVENPDMDGNGTDASYGVVDNIYDNWLPHGVWAVILDQDVHCAYRNNVFNDRHIYTIWADAGSLNVIPLNETFVGHVNWSASDAWNDVTGTSSDELLVYANDWEVVAEVAGHGDENPSYLNNYIWLIKQCHADTSVTLWKLDNALGSFYDTPTPRITLQNGNYFWLGGFYGYGANWLGGFPSNSWYADWDTTKSHSDFHTPKWGYTDVWQDAYTSLSGAPNNNILQAGWYVFLTMLYETGWHDSIYVAGWEHQHSSHIKNANVYAAAAHWANGEWATTGLSESDIDHDGVNELVMYSDKILAVFEHNGGRAQWVFTKDASKGYAYSVVGSDNAYYGCTEGDYNDNYGGCNTWNHVGAFSDMYPWYEHLYYDWTIDSTGTTLQATLTHEGLTKIIRLTEGDHYLEAIYDVGPMTSYIQSGFSPDLTDMVWTGDHYRVWDPEGKYMGQRNPNSGATGCYVLGDGQCHHNKDMQGTLINTDEIYGPDEFRFFLFAGYTSPPDGNGEIAVLESLATLITDTFSPKVRVTAEFVDNNTVGISFNEKVDETTAETYTNYAFSAFDSTYTPTAATLQSDSVRVWIDIAETFVEGDSGKITVSNVKDLANNVVDPTENYAILEVPPCFTPHTVTVDGIKDFNAKCEILDSLVADPLYEGDGDYDYLYFTWNADHVYIGYESCRFDSSGDLFVYFDSDTGGTNYSTDWYVIHEFPPGFLADYAICAENGDWSDKRVYNAGTGQWETTWLGNTGCEIYVGWKDIPYTEISVPDSEIAYDPSDTLKMIVYCQQEEGGNLWIAFPPGNPHDLCVLNRYYLFESLNLGVQPNTAFQVVVEDFVPPAAPTVPTAIKSGDDIFLHWSPVAQDTAGCLEVVDHYVILRDTDPDSLGPGDTLSTSPDTTYLDTTAAVGNTGVQHYYAVEAVDEGNNKSAPSSPVGEYDRSTVH